MNKKQLTKVVNEVIEMLTVRRTNHLLGKVTEAKPKATKKDIAVVVEYWTTGDYSRVEGTKLFTEYGGEYCRVLELLNRMKIERA